MLKTMIGALALAATIPAAAGESRVVRYDDLNLASPAGIEALERRVEMAVRMVCGANTARVTGPGEYARTRECMTKARAQAAKQVAALQSDNARGG